MKFGLTVLRAIVGALFIGHGTQKLFGWFGGHGLEGTGQFMETLGLKPGRRQALASGAAEAGGGALLALGLLTPVAVAALIGVMSTAIKTVHLEHGPWAQDNGFEYPLALIAALVAIADVGPGDMSLDRALDIDVSGPVVALLALGAGVGGAALLTRGGGTEAPSVVPAPEPQAAAAS
jgi:putative oxidoreductase